MIHIRVPFELHEWLKAEFPHGFLQSFGEGCFRNLQTLIKDGEMPPPSEFARQATLESVARIAR